MYVIIGVPFVIGCLLGIHASAFIQAFIIAVVVIFMFMARVIDFYYFDLIDVLCFVSAISGILAGDLYVYIVYDHGSIGKMFGAVFNTVFTPAKYR